MKSPLAKAASATDQTKGRLKSILGNWLGTLSGRIGLVVFMSATIFTVITALIGYIHAVSIATDKQKEILSVLVNERTRELNERLNRFSNTLSALSTSTTIAAALIDSEGRNRHITPFLELAASELSSQTQSIPSADQGIGAIHGIVLSILDHKGGVITSSATGFRNHEGQAWVKSVLNGTPYARMDGNRVIVAFPIVLPGTGTAEGIMIGEADFSEIFGNQGKEIITHSARWRVDQERPSAGWITEASEITLVRDVVVAAPLDNLKLRTVLAYPQKLILAQAFQVLWVYLIMLLISLPLAYLTGMQIGKRLAVPLQSLAAHAKLLGREKLSQLKLAPVNYQYATREIHELASSLQLGMEHLDEAQVAQARLAAIVQDSRDAVISSSQEIVQTWNPAAERMFGYSANEIIGKSIRTLINEADLEEFEAAYASLQKGGHIGPKTIVRKCKNGSDVKIECIGFSINADDGQVTAITEILRDISEREKLEGQLRQSQKMEAIGQLTGGLAHDFNNLLGVVVGNLDLMEERLPPDAELKRRHHTALQAALRGAEVTRSLLAVARRQPMHIEVHDLNALVVEMLPLVKSSVGASVTVRMQLLDGELPAKVDAAGLSNALLNLVINSRDAMKGQSTQQNLVMRTRKERIARPSNEAAAMTDYAVLEVTDSGPGMSDKVKERAFEPFFTTKEMGNGTGLGLSMVRGFTEQLGGTVSLDSQPGRGTTVTLYLPLEQAKEKQSWESETERLQALDCVRVLDTPPEAEFDDLAGEAARICGTPVALVSLVDKTRQWFKSAVGTNLRETLRRDAFCAHAIKNPNQVMIVEDASIDPRFSANPLVTGEPFIRFYAGSPLTDSAGYALGTLCVIDTKPRQLTAEQIKALAILSERVSKLLRARHPVPDASRIGNSIPKTAQPPIPSGRGNVLVVDDEPALCELACDWIESIGYRAKGVHSAAEALAALEQDKYDLLFTDIVMPGGMDGLALANKAKTRWPDMKLLLASGYSRALSEQDDLPALLLNKPYRKHDLVNQLTQLLAADTEKQSSQP